MISHLALLCKYLFGFLHTCIFYLFSPLLQPYFPHCSYKEDSYCQCGMIALWGLLAMSLLPHKYREYDVHRNEGKCSENDSWCSSIFPRHQNWCRMFTPPWPQYCYELHAGKGSGEPIGSREMLQRESTSWNSLENWDLEQGKNGSKHYVPYHQEMSMQGIILLILIFFSFLLIFFFSLVYKFYFICTISIYKLKPLVI